MAKKPNTFGGGARTNFNGLEFEQNTELKDALTASGYIILGNKVILNGKIVARLFPKHDLYSELLIPANITYTDYISKKLLPDDSILVGNTLYIVEKKFQSSPGSVDEKLQTCDFKKKQYTKLLAPLNINVEYYYYLCEWFKDAQYDDVKEYILSVGCKYYFDEIPLTDIGL